jgi:hypothetical protein
MSTQQQRPPLCCVTVIPNERGGFAYRHQCTRVGSIERDGKFYCKQHDPVAVKQKQDARFKAWSEKYDSGRSAASERQHRADCFDDLLAALEARIIQDVVVTGHAVHPSGRFCQLCGVNSPVHVHSPGCPTGQAEAAIAKARQSTNHRDAQRVVELSEEEKG